MDVFLPFDFAVLDWIAEHLRCGFMDFIMPLITRLGDEGIFWIAVALILLIFPKTRKTGAMMGVAMLLGLLIGNKILKPLIGRMRPYDVREILPYLIEPESSKSFPSGHTLVCFEAATVLMLRHAKPWGIVALVTAFLVAFSRMYLFVHYPTDIFGGIILGTLFGFCGMWIVNGFMKLMKKN